MDNLKVTKRLYSTGKVPQQAVLDIQIRKSELTAQVKEIEFALESLKYQLSALLGSHEVIDIDLKSVPWNHLKSWQEAGVEYDYQEKALAHNLEASDLKVSAQKRNLIPDITLGMSYTKRNKIDGLGDFVGASISFPLPISSQRYADKNTAVFERLEAEHSYRNYKENKPHLLKKIEFEVKDLRNQLSILQRETLKFAKSSRDITAKSYSRGAADYTELLRAELQYQNQLIKEIKVVAKLKSKQVEYLFIKGDDLMMESKS